MFFKFYSQLVVLTLVFGLAHTGLQDVPSIKAVSLDVDETDISNSQDYVHLIPGKFTVSCNASFPVVWKYHTPSHEIPGNTVRFRRHYQGSKEEDIFETILELKNPTENHQGWLTCQKKDASNINTTFFLYVKQKQNRFSRFILQDSLKVIKLRRGASKITFPCLLDGPIDEKPSEILLFSRGRVISEATYIPHIGFQISAPAPKNFNAFRETYECRIFHPGTGLDEKEEYKNLMIFVVVFEKGVIVEALVENQLAVRSDQRQVFVPKDFPPIKLFCQDTDPGSKLQVVHWRSRQPFSRQKVKYSPETMEMAMFEVSGDSVSDKDVFACVRTNEDSLSFPVEVLHQWEINYSDPVKLDMEYLENLNRRIIRCKFWNSTNPNNMKLRIAKCTTEEQCSWILGSQSLGISSGLTDRSLQLQQANESNALETEPELFSGWEDITRSVGRCACEQVQIVDYDEIMPCECYQYTAKHTGLVQCLYDTSGSASESMKMPGGSNFPRETKFITSGFRAPSDDANECAAEDQSNALDQLARALYFANTCFNIFQSDETYTIKCVGLQGNFAENFYWKIHGIPLLRGSNLTLTDYTFAVRETFDDVVITSELVIQTGKYSTHTSFPIECIAEHALTSDSDSIKTMVVFGAPNHSNFKSQICTSALLNVCPSSGTVNTVFCTLGKPCEIHCRTESTLFPNPNFKWYKIQDNCQRNQSFAKIRSSIQVERQSLRFLSFQQNNEGTYLCLSIINSINNSGGRMNVCRSEYFNIQVEDSTWKLYLGLGAVIPLCIMAVCAAVFYKIRFKKERTRANMLSAREVHEFLHGNPSAINHELDLSEQAYLLPYQMAYEFPFDKLVLGKQLGAGAYGTVVKAEADGILQEGLTTTVAVKTAHANADLTYFKALLKELKVMIHVGSHLNVVNLLGACTVHLKNKQVYIIVEFCCYGNLQQYMHKYRNRFIDQVANNKIDPAVSQMVEYTTVASTAHAPVRKSITLDSRGCIAAFQSPASRNYCQFSPVDSSGSSCLTDREGGYLPLWRSNVEGDYNELELEVTIRTTTLVNWSYQIATGMEYLASKKIFHGDLAARNVLLTQGGIVKIADFGLARQVYSDINYVKKENCPLPVKWMALESLLRLEFSSQSDIWSYGVLLWEIFTLGCVPYPEIPVSSSFVTTILDGIRLSKPMYATDEIYSMMSQCWADEPSDRPDFSTLRMFFRQCLQDIDETTYQEVRSCEEREKETWKRSQVQLDDSPLPARKLSCGLL